MTTLPLLPDAGSYVEMSVSDEPTARVRVVDAEGARLILSAPRDAVPGVGSAVALRWSAAPRGRYALSCRVLDVEENMIEVEAQRQPVVEQHRNFVRGGGGEQVRLRRAGFPEASGWIRDISEHSMRGHFAGAEVNGGDDLRLEIQLGTELVVLDAVATKVAALPQRVPPGPMSVEMVAVFEPDESQARIIRRYVMRQQLLSRTRA
ncbi:hypothetical protein ACIBSW_33035 [Actinoplanes sp. NPDC049668]|uniref:hypothetical protein n=1 Tax=unclassified Actinoplanes TaxID=2626549 RepID=UPI0033AE2F90